MSCKILFGKMLWSEIKSLENTICILMIDQRLELLCSKNCDRALNSGTLVKDPGCPIKIRNHFEENRDPILFKIETFQRPILVKIGTHLIFVVKMNAIVASCKNIIKNKEHGINIYSIILDNKYIMVSWLFFPSLICSIVIFLYFIIHIIQRSPH